jgi:hypothetical protein
MASTVATQGLRSRGTRPTHPVLCEIPGEGGVNVDLRAANAGNSPLSPRFTRPAGDCSIGIHCPPLILQEMLMPTCLPCGRCGSPEWIRVNMSSGRKRSSALTPAWSGGGGRGHLPTTWWRRRPTPAIRMGESAGAAAAWRRRVRGRNSGENDVLRISVH